MSKPVVIFDYHLDDIICEELVVNNHSKDDIKNVMKSSSSELGVKLDYKEEDHSVIVFIKVRISGMDEEGGEIKDELDFIKINYSFHFVLNKKKKVIDHEEILKNESLILTFLSVSYSTYRGMFYEKLSSSPYKDISPLPIINPRILLDLVKDENKEDIVKEAKS